MNSFKLSRFTVIRERDLRNIAYNFNTSALVELSNDSFRLIKAANNSIINLTDEEIEQHKLLLFSFFVPAELDEIKYLKLHYRQIQKDTSDLSLTILTTLSCNFNCYYCYEHKTGGFLKDEVKQSILNLISKRVGTLKRLGTCWSGGEPLLFWNQIYTLSDRLKKIADEQGFLYYSKLVSNSYLLSPQVADNLFDAGVKELQVTYDGPREYHDKIRNHKGSPSFEVITENVRHALERWKVIIRVNASRENKQSIPHLIEQLAEAGLNDGGIIYFAPLHANGLGCRHLADSNSEILIPTSEFHTYSLELKKMAFDHGFKIRLPLSASNSCSAVVASGIVIEPNGVTKKCWLDIGDITEKFGSLKASGLRIIQNHNLDKWLNYNPFSNEECLECYALPCCFGGCPWEAMKGRPLESRCHPLKKSYEEYINLLCEWITKGAVYDSKNHTIRKR